MMQWSSPVFVSFPNRQRCVGENPFGQVVCLQECAGGEARYDAGGKHLADHVAVALGASGTAIPSDALQDAVGKGCVLP